MATQTLADAATSLRASLLRSDTNTGEMVSILGSFDHRLSALDAAMRPVQVRMQGVRTAQGNVERAMKAADSVLLQFDICRQVEASIHRGPHKDVGGFLEAVSLLRGSSEFFRTNNSFTSSDGMLNHINALLASATSKLEVEFQQILSSNSLLVEPDQLFSCLSDTLRPLSGPPMEQGHSVDNSEHQYATSRLASYKLPALISPRILPLLHDITLQLVLAKRQLQCSKIYGEKRSAALWQILQKLGVERDDTENVKMLPWEVLEPKIRNWVQHIRIAVKLLFAGEKQICDQLFKGNKSLREHSFAEATSSSIRVLLCFGAALAKSKMTPEKLVSFLDMYETMQELQPEIEKIFEGKACSDSRGAALNLTQQLAHTILETFKLFVETIEKEGSKAIVPDGKVHPLTSYVINYIKYLLEYRSTLELLFGEAETGGRSNSQLKSAIMQILLALQSNLEFKSKQYKDQALAHLFLMNNIHYMVMSVRKSETKDLLGEDWVQRYRRVVQQNATQYKRVTWAKILQSLSTQGLTSSVGGSSSGASKEAVKERFKSFNAQFEELHQRQSQWIVPDAELRESLRLMIAEVLLPAHRSFVKRFGPLVETSRHAEKFIKYTPENVDFMLAEFFEGKTV